MKALTLTQPWATLIAIGEKRIETRGWGTDYRGPLAIHAAKGLGPVHGRRGLFDLCHTEPFLTALKREYPNGIDDQGPRVDVDALPVGSVIAVARLADVVRVGRLGGAVPEEIGPPWSDAPHEAAFGNYSPGRFAWILTDVRPLPEPIAAGGELGLWTWWEAPQDLVGEATG